MGLLTSDPDNRLTAKEAEEIYKRYESFYRDTYGRRRADRNPASPPRIVASEPEFKPACMISGQLARPKVRTWRQSNRLFLRNNA